MPDLLLEFFSEEIPARMQAKAAEDLQKLVTGRLVDAGLVYEGARAFATPRRLALWVQGLPVRQPDVREEKKGPRVGAPENAVAGFLKSAGLTSIDQATVQKDPKKGDFYVALIEKPGRPAIEVIAEIVPQVVRGFPWPKSMRWGAASAKPGALGWVRPLHSIVATFGPETEEPDVVPFVVDGVAAGDVTRGHRFLAPEPLRVRRLDDYVAKLEAAKVVLDPARRQEMILADAKNLAFAQGFELVADAGLLAEVAGLVEWPVVLMGAFDEAFLSIPPEVIRTTIRNNQKCFVLRRPGASSFETPPAAAPQDEEKGRAPAHGPHPEEARSAVSKDGHTLANRFILVANTEAADGGKAIVAGNERVIRARLADAKFFYETDLKIPLEARLPKLEEIVFHEKLGTQAERVARIERLARELAPLVGTDPEKAARAARLAKADLVTEMVGEFPELQGLMGKYYALAQGEDASVARACEEHYKPLGPSDRVPTDPVSVAVALADKIDMLVWFFGIRETPTGSKDPYALRRAALGVVRLVLENGLRLPLFPMFSSALGPLLSKLPDPQIEKPSGDYSPAEKLLMFFADRLQVQLREQGARYDLVNAVFALTEIKGANQIQDDLLLIVRRVEALARFLDTTDGQNLLIGYRRAASILRIEEKKDGKFYTDPPDQTLFREPPERHLWNTIQSTVIEARLHLKLAYERVGRPGFENQTPFDDAMDVLSTLRADVDVFFESVTVNVEDKKLRENRLKLLNEIRQAANAVADFSKIEG